MSNPEEESLWDEISRLSKEIEELSKKKKEYETKIKELMFKEDPSKGIYFHKEIFELQQKKLMTEFEIDCRRKKKNRILWYLEESKIFDKSKKH